MMRDRLITAAVLAAIILPLLFWGRTAGIAILVAMACTLALWELCTNMPGLKGSHSVWLAIGLGLVIVALFYLLPFTSLLLVPALLPLVVLIIHLLLYDVIENTVESASQMVFALGYVVVPLCHAILMRRLDMGVTLVLYILIVVCLGDTGAYFSGKYLGKHPLAPKISPSKTVEGLGGVVAGGLLGMVFMKTVVPDLPGYEVLLPLTLALVVAGPVGDLIASALKRRLEIKDFGTAIRGHGGLMDRADSLIVAFPTGYYFLILTGHFIPK